MLYNSAYRSTIGQIAFIPHFIAQFKWLKYTRTCKHFKMLHSYRFAANQFSAFCSRCFFFFQLIFLPLFHYKLLASLSLSHSLSVSHSLSAQMISFPVVYFASLSALAITTTHFQCNHRSANIFSIDRCAMFIIPFSISINRTNESAYDLLFKTIYS